MTEYPIIKNQEVMNHFNTDAKAFILLKENLDQKKIINEIKLLIKDLNQLDFKDYTKFPEIKRWRQIYKENNIGLCSGLENLCRSQKYQRFPRINPIIDYFNLISVYHRISLGLNDLDKIKKIGSKIHFDLLKSDIQFKDFNDIVRIAEKNKPTYYVLNKDNIPEIITWNWNTKESNQFKITDSTKNYLLVIDCLTSLNKEEVSILERYISKIQKI